jgi:hypothetical protein
MSRIALLFITAALFGADNPWAKVQEIKSGSDLRIFKKGSSMPLAATFDEANDERMVIIVKNEQIAISKEDIDRVDARPVPKGGAKGRKLTSESKVKTTDPDYTPHGDHGVPVPGTSYSSGLSMSGSGKPDFETVYRRQPAAPKK